MLIGIEKRFIFVSNTKSASTSVEKALSPFSEVILGGTPKEKHISIRDFLANADQFVGGYLNDFDPDEFFKFGIMRDPLEWIGSWYRYRISNKVADPLPKNMSFEEFWERRDWNVVKRDGSPFLQCDKFCDNQGKPMVDVIIPFNDLPNFFGKICNELGIDSPLGKLNISNRKELEVPQDILEELMQHYAKDYELLELSKELNEIGMKKLKKIRRTPG